MKTNHLSALRRCLSVLLTLCMMLWISPLATPPARAQPTYSVAAAMAYADAHWNDGKGLCAEFASNVLRAGGLNMRVKLTTYSCLKEAAAASGLEKIELKLTPLENYKGTTSEMATYALDGDILGAGDLVIQWCYTHNDRPHVLICAGYDSEGYAVFYAHNAAMNKERFQLGDSLAYMHKHDCDMRAYVLPVSRLDPSVQVTDWTPPEPVAPTLNVYAASSVTQTTAHITGSCSYSNDKPSSVGIYLGTSEGSMSIVDSDVINHNKNPFDIWYDLSGLSPNTTYYYKLYANSAGGETYSSTLTFTTPGEQRPEIHITDTTSITQNAARVNGTCAYSGTRPSSVGLYLGTSSSSMSKADSDVINHKKNPFDIWYDLTGLSAGTTYYYQLYAIVGGQEYLSEQGSFTTAGATQNTGSHNISINATGATKLKSTSVQVNGTCSYGGIRPASVGLYWGTSSESMSKVDSDVINHKKNPFDIWYNLSNLSAGTTYYYQLYAIVGGTEYKSNVLSVTTPY